MKKIHGDPLFSPNQRHLTSFPVDVFECMSLLFMCSAYFRIWANSTLIDGLLDFQNLKNKQNTSSMQRLLPGPKPKFCGCFKAPAAGPFDLP